MSLTNHNVATMRIPRLEALLALALCGALMLASPIAESAESGDIVVVSVNGEVRVTTNGAPREAKAGSTLELPATLRTGHDGSVELRQDHTTVSVGPDTQLDFPAAVSRGDPIDRIVQPLGNVFYNVGKRESRKLRVETPYLVAVIKGTQFNVAAQADNATISLFEGRLEVRATDDSDVVDLKAGEIAMRHAGDKTIRVLRMDTGKPPTTAPDSERGTAPTTGLAPRPDDDGSAVPRAPSPLDDEVDNLITGGNPGVTVDPVNGEVAAGANLANTASAQLNAGIDAAAGSVDVGAGAAVDLGPASVDVGVDAGVDLGAGTVDAAVDAGVDAGADLGAGTVDLGADAAVDLGPASVDLGVDAGVDLSAPAVDVGADIGADPGLVDADLGVDAGVDVAAGTIDAGVDTSVVGVDVGVDLGIDLGAGDLGLDVGLGGLDLGLDLGLEEDTTTPDTGTTDTGGALLDGLLRRPGL